MTTLVARGARRWRRAAPRRAAGRVRHRGTRVRCPCCGARGIRYGRDYLDRLGEAGFTPEGIDLAAELPAAVVARYRLRKFNAVEPIFPCR